jgi:ubiquinone/menaquinone biosynthesis C-methylase UbiE
MPGQTNYNQGYSRATVATHASRTVDSDAAFLLPFLRSTDKILDVGCGPGTITVGFAAHVPQGFVTGLDISPDVLEQARSLDNLPSNVSFMEGDLLKGLDMEDGQYDMVFNSQLFPHLNSKEMKLTALREMRRVVRPGGILASRDAAELTFLPQEIWSGSPLGREYDQSAGGVIARRGDAGLV